MEKKLESEEVVVEEEELLQLHQLTHSRLQERTLGQLRDGLQGATLSDSST